MQIIRCVLPGRCRSGLRTGLAFLAAAAVVACIGCTTERRSETPTAFVSILPHRDVAQRIAGGRFDVRVLVGPGLSPHSYAPTPEQMAALSRAEVFFRTGLTFEHGLIPRIQRSMPKLRIVDLRRGIELRTMAEDAEHDHHHGGHDHHDGEHTHDDDHGAHGAEGKDPHIWLSPVLMKTQAATMAESLGELDPDGKTLYQSNLRAVHNELDSLHTHLEELLEPFRGSDFFVFHPAFGYFADEYGLVQKAVEIEGKSPGAKALARLMEDMEGRQPQALFVQPQFSDKSARAIASQLGCAVVPIDPLPGAYFEDMKELGAAVRHGLKGE